MDQSSLFQVLQSSSVMSRVAINSIPHTKTIFERHVIEQINKNQTDEPQADYSDWMSSVKEKAKFCPSLSVADLTELAELTGFRVEISWARQRSQGQLERHFPSYPAGQCHCSNHVPISDWPSDARIWNVYQSPLRTQALRTIRGPAPQASSRSVAFIYGFKGGQYTRPDASERERKNRSARTFQEHPRDDGCQSHGTKVLPRNDTERAVC